jgi:hypothetical protein
MKDESAWRLVSFSSFLLPPSSFFKKEIPVSVKPPASGLVLTAKEKLGWGTVRVGLALVGVGLVLVLIGLAGPSLVAWLVDGPLVPRVVGRLLPGQGGADLICGIVLLAGAGLLHAGLALSWATPQGSAARGWALGTTFFLVVTLGLLFAYGYQFAENYVTQAGKDLRATKKVIPQTPGPKVPDPEAPEPEVIPEPQDWLSLPYETETIVMFGYMVIGVSCLEWLCYLLYLHGVGRVFHDRALALHSLLYLIASLVLGGAAFAAAWVLRATPPPEPNGAVHGLETATWAALGIALVLSLWFLVLVCQAYRTVTRVLTGAS